MQGVLSQHSQASASLVKPHGRGGRHAAPRALGAPVPVHTTCRSQQQQPYVNVNKAAGGSGSSSLRPQHNRRQLSSHVCRAADIDDDCPIEEMAISGGYDAITNALIWERRPVPVISRAINIVTEFLVWNFKFPGDPNEPDVGDATTAALTKGLGGGNSFLGSKRNNDKGRALHSERQVRRAAEMRELLVRLGPAFVKIGQALSSRPDVLPPSFLVELEALQDKIPPFDSQDAFKVIEQELGAPLSSIFREISAEPVAAASLGQVYRAITRDGQEVAVKVQRPGVATAIALDVYILRWLAAAARKGLKVNTDLPMLVDEWATSLFRELDYQREARNAERFKQLYSQLDGVYVPAVYHELTTAKVLTMEWVDGERLRTVADNVSAERERDSFRARVGTFSESKPRNELDLGLVEVGVRCSLEQMLEEGFYHADPHPGNLLRTRDGRLAYLDFGMCGELDVKTRQALIRATLHLVNREYAQLAQDFIDLGLLPPGSDKATIIPALTGVFQQALARGVSNVSFGDLSGQLGRTMYQFSFRIPPYYTLLVRSLSVLEGIALASDPNYKVLGSAYPWVARRLLTNQTSELQSTLRSLLYSPTGTFRFQRLESLLQEAVRTPKALPPATGMPNTGSALSTLPNAPGGSTVALLLTPEAGFVRNILLDELAKGVDAAWRVAVDTAVHNTLHPLPALSRVPVVGPLLVPLVAPLTTTSSNTWGLGGTSYVGTTTSTSGGVRFSSVKDPKEPHLVGPAGAFLAALPQLSSRQDKEQLEGLQKLAVAVSRLAAEAPNNISPATWPSAASSPTTVDKMSGPSQNWGLSAGGLPMLDTAEQLEQAQHILRWLSQELSTLPPAQQAEAFKIPSELAAKVTSRITARTLRSLFAGQLTSQQRQVQGEDILLDAASYTTSSTTPLPANDTARGVTMIEMAPATTTTTPAMQLNMNSSSPGAAPAAGVSSAQAAPTATNPFASFLAGGSIV